VFPTETAYKPPDGSPISNFGGESCGGALFQILAQSCNSAFARMGAEVIGEGTMQAGAKRFGFKESMIPDEAWNVLHRLRSRGASLFRWLACYRRNTEVSLLLNSVP
jgi:cell division protein FtsI/penicillin-binding protein 2